MGLKGIKRTWDHFVKKLSVKLELLCDVQLQNKLKKVESNMNNVLDDWC